MNDVSPPLPWKREIALPGDASNRRYARVWDSTGRTAMLVRYPEAVRGQMERDLEVRAWSAARGLRVPALIDHDLNQGWAVLEDFGSDDAESALERMPKGDRLKRSIDFFDPLTTLAASELTDLPKWNPPLDLRRMRWELAGFELWCLRHHLECAPSPPVGRWLDDLAATIAEHPRRICHRDYHLNNLFLLPGGEVGLIDYQDMLIGPDTYDGVSLLGERAILRLLSQEERRQLFEVWAVATAAAPGWSDRWRLVSLQRGLKVLGTFTRLTLAGATVYERWVGPLVCEVAAQLASADAPSELVDLLLDWSRRRHPATGIRDHGAAAD
jgi:aminoglycoside/choline kinase family phosphotransferase